MALQQLPPSTVRLIGSAQVITSVSSVVKELLENSLDAGASSVDVRLENHGLERIEVRDDGRGVERDDARVMGKPHYTSKLRSGDDLTRLETYGFRGEALSSVCAVAEVAITTKTEADDVSTTYTLNHGGDVTAAKPSHLGQGTTVVVNQLFKNLPVRKQFYNTTKKKRDEVKKVEDLVTSFSVVRHDVRFTLRHNKEILCQSNAVRSPKDVLLKVFGAGTMSHMQHVTKQTPDSAVSVEMYLPKLSCDVQQCSRSSSDRFFCYVNRRPVIMKGVEKKVRGAFNDAMKCDTGRTPLIFLSVTVHLDQVDVNLEPNKTVVMLQNQEEIDNLIGEILGEVYSHSQKANLDGPDSHGGSTLTAQSELRRTGKQQSSSTTPQECDVRVAENLTNNEENLPSSLSTVDTQLLENGFLSPLAKSTQIQSEPSHPAPSNGEATRQDKFVDVDATGDHLSPSETVKIDCETQCTSKQPTGSVRVIVGDNVVEAVRGMDELDDDVLEVNNCQTKCPDSVDKDVDSSCSVTPSQWSKGVALQTAKGPLQPVQLLIPGASRPQQQSTPSPSVAKRDKPKLSGLQSPAQCSLFDVVDQQAVKRPTTSFIFFSKEIRPQVLKENPGASFREIASIIGARWNALSAEEKAKYEQLMTKDVERYREQVYTRGSGSSERSAKRRKISDESSASPRNEAAHKSVTPTRKSAAELRAARAVVPVPFSMAQISRLYEKGFPRLPNQTPSQSALPRLIGPLPSLGLWVVMDATDILVVQPVRAQETVIYRRLLAHHTMPTLTQEQPIRLTSSLVGGAPYWSILQSLPRSAGVPPDPFSYISDPRIARSGFTVRCAQQQPGSDATLEITRLTEQHTVRDLSEILDRIRDNSDVALEDARPAKVRAFLQVEVARMARKLPVKMDREVVRDILKQLFDVLTTDPLRQHCFHERPIALSVRSTSDLNPRQNDQNQVDNMAANVDSPMLHEQQGQDTDVSCNVSMEDPEEAEEVANFDIESSFDLSTQET